MDKTSAPPKGEAESFAQYFYKKLDHRLVDNPFLIKKNYENTSSVNRIIFPPIKSSNNSTDFPLLRDFLGLFLSVS